jgi:hypothetical protein
MQDDALQKRLSQTIERYEKSLDAVMNRSVSFHYPGLSQPILVGDFFSFSSPHDAADFIPKNGEAFSERIDRISVGDLCEMLTMLNSILSEYRGDFGHDAFSFSVSAKYSIAARRLVERGYLFELVVKEILSPAYAPRPRRPAPT